MKVCHGSHLIFYLSGKQFKAKEIQIWLTAIFVFFILCSYKIAVSVEIFCSCKGNWVCVKGLMVITQFSISTDVSFNEILSNLDFWLTGAVLKKLVVPLQIKKDITRMYNLRSF